MSRPETKEAGSAALEARDVMTFGQEVGRVLSDGRMVGRAEPYAKVFPSSRVVKRAVGLAAWGVLEDIALDARLDERGRLVADTSVRRIAGNLGLNKDTVTKYLGRLRDFGFVLHEELRTPGSGQYGQCRYVLDPSACIERFTFTPAGRPEPCPKVSDTVAPTVSEDTGHGGFGHLQEQERLEKQQQDPPAGGLLDRLQRLGVSGPVAEGLLAAHPAERVEEALAAVGRRSVRDPAAWVVSALQGDWDLTPQRRSRPSDPPPAAIDTEAPSQPEVATGWYAAISASFDDGLLACVIEQVGTPVPALHRRSAPVVRAQLLAWAVTPAGAHPSLPLRDAVLAALAAGLPLHPLPEPLPPAPAAPAATPDLTGRVRACLASPRQGES